MNESSSYVSGKRVVTLLLSGLALLIPLLLFKVLNERIMKGQLGYDEQFFAWGGWSITRGLRPYLDFFEFKPPMVFITHAFGIWTNGDHGLRFRIFFSSFAATSILALHLSLISRRMNRILSTALMSALVLAWVNPAYHDNALQDAESIGLSYYFLGVAALIADTGRYRRYFEALGGALLTCTVLSKEPFGGAVVGTWATAFFFIYGVENFKVNALRYVKSTYLGIAAFVLVLCIYMVPTGSMKAYIQLMVSYAAMFRDSGTSYCVLLGRWKPSTPLNELFAQAQYINSQFFNLKNIGYLFPLLAASAIFIAKQSRVLFLSSLATLLLAVYAVTATNCQWSHYYNMALSGMFFFMIVGADRLSTWMKSHSWIAGAAILSVFVVTIAVAARPRVKTELAGWPYHFPPVDEPIAGVFDFVARNSAPGDTIVTTGPPLLYMYTNRRNAVRESSFLDEFITYYPGRTDEEKLSGLRAELIQNRPRIVILDPFLSERQVRHIHALLEPFLTEFKYRKVGMYYYLRPD